VTSATEITAMTGAIKLSVDSKLDLVALVARAVRALCTDLLAEEDIDAVELSVVEAMTNVIRHGYEQQEGRNVEVTVQLRPHEVAIAIIDEAAPMNGELLKQASAERFAFDESDLSAVPERGMGLALIRMNMDDVEYHSSHGKNELHMVKRVKSRA
jgi:serine/threonine-protein kinase RsbW